MSFFRMLVLSSLLFTTQALGAEYIVKYSNDKSVNNLFYGVQKMSGAEMTEVYYPGKLARVQVADVFASSTFLELQNSEDVEYVIENYKVELIRPFVGTNANLQDQYANQITGVTQAWEAAGNEGSKSVVVAVIDTGADYRHESLRDNMVPGYDFAEDDDDPDDKTSFQNPGHGTHCSGSVGATGTVDGGTQGASPAVSLMPIRFLNENGSGDLLASVKAIDFAIEKGAHILSNSWGAQVPEEQARPIIEAIGRAEEAGITFVAAAGNSSLNNDANDFFPTNAANSNMISVAASDSSDSQASFTNYGKHRVHIAAPGVDIVSTLPNNRYGNLSGTSMAAPFVSGAVAFLKAQDDSLTPQELRALIQATGDPVDIETACNCRINVASAYRALASSEPFFVPVTTTVAPGATQNFYVRSFDAVEFTSSDAAIAEINSDGVLTGKANGEVTLTAKDAEGNTVDSMTIRISDLSDVDDGGGGECPFGDKATCDLICSILPDLCRGFGL